MNSALPLLALTMGLLSSFHCIGMCGPIALALPVHRGSRWQQLSGLLIYNSGRTLTYSLLGVLFGLIGSSLILIGFLRYATIAVGLLLLLYVLTPSKVGLYLHPPLIWEKAVSAVKNQLARQLRSKSAGGWLLLGIFNGLLPCGLIYMALISSIATGSVAGGGMFMLLFGIGTLPAMMAVGFFRQYFSPLLRAKFRRVVPILLGIAGVWLIVRGVLIKYPVSSGEIPVCHGKMVTR